MDNVGAIVQPGPYESGPRTGDRLLTIGQFSRRSRLSAKALRLYERQGLLRPEQVDPGSGYRRYRESQLGSARLVATLRRLDMPLAVVATIVAAPPPRGASLLAEYWDGVERRVASQRELAMHLRIRLAGDPEGALSMYEIHQRDVPEQLVLTEQRHVLVEELPAWLGQSMPRAARSADELGGMTGPQFVIYHGEVNQDSDGPVEVCTPIDPSGDGPIDRPTRREPAHREVYVRLRKAQVAYPQILSAFDAVFGWIGAQKRSMAGPPREVYFCDFNAAGPDDEVCDVACPID